MRRIKWPTELEIGNNVYKIKYAKQIVESGTDCWGLFDPSTFTITVVSKQSKRNKLITIIHEALHGAEEEYKFKLGHKRIEKLEVALADFLLNNF